MSLGYYIFSMSHFRRWTFGWAETWVWATIYSLVGLLPEFWAHTSIEEEAGIFILSLYILSTMNTILIIPTTVYQLHNLEEKVRSHRAATTSKRPDKDLAHIIPDTRLSRSRTTRYCLTLDLYWYTKKLMACHLDSVLKRSKCNLLLKEIKEELQ